jgi:hypothetical protein
MARFFLTCAFLAAFGYGLWNGGVDLYQLRALRAEGRMTEAQIITMQTVGGDGKTGRVGYGFRVGETVVTGQRQVLRSLYPRIRMGDYLPVTYLPAQPHVHRLGRVDAALLGRRAFYWSLSLLHALAWFGLPLALLEIRRRRALLVNSRNAHLATPISLPTE